MADEKLLSEIKGNIETKIDFLKSCKDYGTKEALNAIIFLRDTFWSMAPGHAKEILSSKLSDFMIKQGLAQLLVEMLQALNTVNVETTNEALHELHQMLFTIASKLTKSVSVLIREELIIAGILQAFVKDLDTFDPNTANPRQRIRIIDNLFRLHDLVHTSGAALKYREQGAIPTLMKYVKAADVNTKVCSLQVLACIVNETESKQLGASGIMGAMVGMLRQAVEASDRKYQNVIKVDEGERRFQTSLLTLTEGFIDLTTNDANKMAIVINGGIPVLSAILRPDYTDEETCAAAEALWKLSFLDSIRDLVSYHLTDTDTTALRVLKDMRSSTTPKLRDVSKGLLYQLGLIEIHEKTP